MQKIYILGETTYDIIFDNNKPVDAKVGGSQLNTAISLGRINLPVTFISQMGCDKVGDICASFIKDNGIDDSLLQRTKGTTRIALAFLDKNKNASYNFFEAPYKSPCRFPKVVENDIIFFGSSFATRTDIHNELLKFLKDAKNRKAIIIYDPNIRINPQTKSKKRLQLAIENMQIATIVKGSDEDFRNIYGYSSSDEVWTEIRKLGVKALFFTANKNGVKVHWERSRLFMTVPVIEPVSTIGAGDNFSAGLIYSLYIKKIKGSDLENLTSEDWSQMAKISTKFAQKVCMSYENYIPLEFADSLNVTH